VGSLAQKLQNRFRCGEFARNVITVASGTVVAQVILAVSVLALARLYDQGPVGLLSNYMAIGTIVALIVTGRYEQAIVLPKNDEDALDLARLSLILAGVGTLVCLLLMVLLYQPLARSLQTPMMEGWFFVLLVSIFLNAMRTTLGFLLNRWKRYKGLSKSRMWNAAVAVALKLALFPLAQTGLLLGAVGGQFAGIGMLLKQAKSDVPGSHPFAWSNLRRVAREYKKFPLFMMPSAVTDSVAMYLPVLGAGFYFSPETAGNVAIAMGLLCLPAGIVGSAIAQVFYQECTVSLHAHEYLKVRNLLFKTWTRLFFTALLPMGVIYFWGPEIFSFVLGEKWATAGFYATILAPLFLSDLIRSPTASAFVTLGLQRRSFVFSLLTICTRAGALVYACHVNDYAAGLGLTVLIEIFLMATFNARILFELKRRRVARERELGA